MNFEKSNAGESENKLRPEIIEAIEELHFLSPEEKVDLLMVATGQKPAAFLNITRSKKSNSEDAVQTLENLRTILGELELPYRLLSHEQRPMMATFSIEVGNNQESLNKFMEADEYYFSDYNECMRRTGLALGYPESAVNAFLGFMKNDPDSVVAPDLSDELKSDPAWPFLNFRFSLSHIEEAMEVAKKREKMTRESAPDLYKKIVERAENERKGSK